MTYLDFHHPIVFAMLLGDNQPIGYEQFILEKIDGKPVLTTVSSESAKTDSVTAEKMAREVGYSPIRENPEWAELLPDELDSWILRGDD